MDWLLTHFNAFARPTVAEPNLITSAFGESVRLKFFRRWGTMLQTSYLCVCVLSLACRQDSLRIGIRSIRTPAVLHSVARRERILHKRERERGHTHALQQPERQHERNSRESSLLQPAHAAMRATGQYNAGYSSDAENHGRCVSRLWSFAGPDCSNDVLGCFPPARQGVYCRTYLYISTHRLLCKCTGVKGWLSASNNTKSSNATHSLR